MFEPYLMGQYQYPWQGMTPMPNWQPQTPQVAQGQQVIQGVRFRCGVYEVLANFTYVATVAGVQETQMFRNGNAVPGAHALDTVATVGDNVSQAFHAIVTVPKNAPTATLNFKSANATSVRVANVIVAKVA